jgi:putative FmdB family regulatory protein
MPLYEYLCPACGHAFDRLQRVDAPDPACPACGQTASRRVSRTSFRLKGSGWYSTDYAAPSAPVPTDPASSGVGGDAPGSEMSASSDATLAPASPADAPTASKTSEPL